MKASSDVMDRIGRLVDKADNFYHASQLPVQARIHIGALCCGMREIRDELRMIFKEVTGDDPWLEDGDGVSR